MELTIKTPATETSAVEVKDYSSMPELAAGIPMERLNLANFWTMHNIVNMEKKLNQSDAVTGNGVHFLQFYTGDNKCHNVYFSKNAALILDEMDMEKGSELPSNFFKEFKFAWSLTPSKDIKDETGKVIKEGYAWKVVSPKEGGNRVDLSFFEM